MTRVISCSTVLSLQCDVPMLYVHGCNAFALEQLSCYSEVDDNHSPLWAQDCSWLTFCPGQSYTILFWSLKLRLALREISCFCYSTSYSSRLTWLWFSSKYRSPIDSFHLQIRVLLPLWFKVHLTLTWSLKLLFCQLGFDKYGLWHRKGSNYILILLGKGQNSNCLSCKICM